MLTPRHQKNEDARALIAFPGERWAGRTNQDYPEWAWMIVYYSGFYYPNTPECVARLLGM